MLASREVATYHALPRPKMDEEAQVMLPAAPASSKMSKWMVRGVTGFLALGALATVCYLKFSPGSFGQADVLASQMKMMDYYPPCPTGSMHQCPQSWKSAGNPGVVGGLHLLCLKLWAKVALTQTMPPGLGKIETQTSRTTKAVRSSNQRPK